jgi:hypothetical protein
LRSNLFQIRPIVDFDSPVRSAIFAGQRFQRRDDHVFDLVEQDRGWPARPWLVTQAVEPVRDEPAPPPDHTRLVHTEVGGDLFVRRSLSASQHDLRPHRQILSRLGPPRPRNQLRAFGIAQHQLRLRSPLTTAIMQAGEPLGGKLASPFRHRSHRQTQIPRDTGVR